MANENKYWGILTANRMEVANQVRGKQKLKNSREHSPVLLQNVRDNTKENYQQNKTDVSSKYTPL